jgi:hypothetical protein
VPSINLAAFNLADPTDRAVLADALTDADRPAEAEALRSGVPVLVRRGRVVFIIEVVRKLMGAEAWTPQQAEDASGYDAYRA